MSGARWAHWLRVAAQCGVHPHAFWRLSLREWRWLTEAPAAQAMRRSEFEALARRFPDEDHGGFR